MTELRLTINGEAVCLVIEPRESLSDVIRDRLNLTGTHVGCDHGACGACTVLLDGTPVRSCVVLAARCDDHAVTTVEGTRGDPVFAVLRRHFHEKHAVQCGFCTPGMLFMAADIIRRHPDPSEATVRAELSGQICRCTGYIGIIAAILSCAAELRKGAAQD